MRWVFVLLGWCLLGGMASAAERLEPIKACPLIRLIQPVPASHPQCAESHCVDLGQGRSICKCVPETNENPSYLIVFDGDKEIQRWRAEAYVRRTDDFEVLSGDLRGDGRSQWIIANHEMSSQGMLVRVWSLHVLDQSNLAKPPISWSVSDYGPGSFALPTGPQQKGCDLLITEWLEGETAQGKSGLYFLGSWYRLGSSDIVAIKDRLIRFRRYLYAFERERAQTTSEDTEELAHLKGRPGLWLRPERASPYDPKKIMLKRDPVPTTEE